MRLLLALACAALLTAWLRAVRDLRELVAIDKALDADDSEVVGMPTWWADDNAADNLRRLWRITPDTRTTTIAYNANWRLD